MKKLLFLFMLSVLTLGLVWAQGSEDFSNASLTTSYANGSFIGNDGFTWTYSHSRNPDVYPIDGAGLMLRRASDSYLEATIPGGIGSFSFQYRKAFTGAGARNIELIINGQEVGTTGEFGAANGADPEIHTFYLEGIDASGSVQVKIKPVGNSSSNSQSVIDNIVWTGHAGQVDPTIFITGTLSGFSSLKGNTSSIQTYSVSAVAIDDPIQIEVPGGFEISLNEVDYNTTISLTPTDGNVDDTPIFVRLSGTAEGQYSGNIVHSCTDADTKNMPVEGIVFPAIEGGYYVNFDGDGETKGSYGSGSVTLSGLEWDMTQVLIGGGEEADWKHGLRSARFRGYGTSSFAMQEDKENGLGAISFLYRQYGNDSQVSWIVEYSTDQGNDWTQIGESFTATATVQRFYEEVNVAGGVRIRFRTEDTGSSNKRMCMDDINLTHYSAPAYDIPEGDIVDVNGVDFLLGGGNANIVAGGVVPAWQNSSFTPSFEVVLQLLGAGPWDLLIDTPAQWGAYYRAGAWVTEQNYGSGILFSGITAAKDMNLPIILGGEDPTLPVELSSFLVGMNAANQAVLSWISQSETALAGYYILRNVSEDLGSAVQISNLIPATNSSSPYSYSYVDSELNEYGSYYYWLQVNDLDGSIGYHGPINLVYGATEDPELPPMVPQTELKRIYPNPFNPSTNVAFYLAKAANVSLKIYNHRGQLVRSLHEGYKEAGDYRLNWDGKDEKGAALSTGVYFFRLEAGKKVFTQKAVLMK